MPWTCPACQNTIRHSEIETAPRLGITYRCTICRLELVVAPEGSHMALAPWAADFDDAHDRAPEGRGRRR
jgi:hypothetical protein